MYRKRARQYAAPVAVTSSVEQVTGQRSINLSGREFVADVVVTLPAPVNGAAQSSIFETNATLINPSDPTLFSWLTDIAQKFEEYKFRYLAFTYEPQCTTTTTGCVGIYFDPDPDNTPPQSWSTFTNTGCNTHGACWAKHTLVLPPRYFAERKQYYVAPRFSDPQNPARIDSLEYFVGSVGTSTVGVLGPTSGTGNTYLTIGKLYLDYNVSFFKAKLEARAVRAILGTGNVSDSNVPPALKTGVMVSPYLASGSGTGAVAKFSGTQTFAQTAFAVIGALSNGAASSLSFSLYGNNYFTQVTPNQNLMSGVIANQTVTLFYTLIVPWLNSDGLALPVDPVVWYFANGNNDKSTLSTFKSAGWSQTTAGVDDRVKEGIFCGTLTIHKGDRISLIFNGNQNGGQADFNNTRLYLCPFTWGLDQ